MSRKTVKDIKNQASKYMVVLERDQAIAVYREGNTYRRYSLPTFEKEMGKSPESTIIKQYKSKMGYEIINLVFKGLIKRIIDEQGTTENILLYRGTECYGSPKSDKRSATEWISKERLHRYQKGGDIAQDIANLTEDPCSVFTYRFGESEPVKSEICMIDRICEKHIPEVVDVIRLGYRTVEQTYAFSKAEFPNFAGYMVTNEFMRKFYKKPNQYVFAYFDNEKILGTISLYHNKKLNTAEFCLLAVHPEYMKTKIGRSLLSYAVDFAKNLGCIGISAEMMFENTPLKNWILRRGFEVEKTFKAPNCPYEIGVIKKMF
jgi:GNAT superfamily N-acetyltransferase